MAEGDINYLNNNNIDCSIEKNGVRQRASLVVPIPPDGFSISQSFELAVNMGKLHGFSVIDKFGLNPLITSISDPEDVWEGGNIYTYDTFGTAPIVSIASSSGSDTQDISIQGLDINGNFIGQIITLTGSTRKALDTALWRVFKMENEADSSGDLVGTVFCYIGTGTVPTLGDPEIRAIIDNGNNQTLMAIYTIPKGNVGFLYRGEIGMVYTGSVGAGTNFAKVQYMSRRVGKVFKIKKVISTISAANSNFQDKRSFPDIIPSFTDIKIHVKEVSEDMGVWSTFDILLVDESKFSLAYLQAIGQPGY